MTIQQQHRGVIPEWDVADRMSKALRSAGISVTDMAATLGVSRETIGRWINGRGAPGRAALLAFAAVTGVDMAWLENGEAPASSSTPAPADQLPRLDSNQQPSGYRLTLVSGSRWAS